MPAKLSDSLRGLREAWRRDGAVRTHSIFVVVAVIALAVFQPSLAWILATLALLVMGCAAELFNAALETLLDRLHPESNPAIGAAKDMSAAAAFVINALAVAVLAGAVASSFS